MSDRNGYYYQRCWFDFAFENQDKVTPSHTAMYLWFVELNNRMGWAQKFASPASQTMAAIGLKSYNTYIKIFNELISFGVVIEVMASKNQYTACIIALSNFDNTLNKALDKALVKHTPKQGESTGQSTDSIIKPVIFNKEQLELYKDFDFFNDDFKIVWFDFLKMRVKIRKPATIAAEKLGLKKLVDICLRCGAEHVDVVNNSIENSWQTFYEPKKNKSINSDGKLRTMDEIVENEHLI